MKLATNSRQQGTITYAILCLILLLVVMQLWLLSATMNAYLGGDDESVLWAAAVASLLLFAVNARLLWFARGLARHERNGS